MVSLSSESGQSGSEDYVPAALDGIGQNGGVLILWHRNHSPVE